MAADFKSVMENKGVWDERPGHKDVVCPIELTVSDNGDGFKVQEVSERDFGSTSLGLEGMKDRVPISRRLAHKRSYERRDCTVRSRLKTIRDVFPERRFSQVELLPPRFEDLGPDRVSMNP